MGFGFCTFLWELQPSRNFKNSLFPCAARASQALKQAALRALRASGLFKRRRKEIDENTARKMVCGKNSYIYKQETTTNVN
jgi:hypothetical protein